MKESLFEKTDKPIAEFSTWGGCSSRAIFNSKLSPGYKNLFHINFSVEGGSLISLMSKPTEFDEKLLTGPKPFSNLCVKHDFSKTFLEFLKKDSIDYLLIDTSFDLTGLLLLSNGNYVSDTGRLHQTKLYETLDIVQKINYTKNFDEFFQLWQKSCKLFFKYIKENCNLKVILNGSRWVYRYYDYENDKIVVYEDFKKKSENRNKYRDILDKYILKKYDVDYLPFNEKSLIDINHIFGIGPAHYNLNYYSEKIDQLKEIINRDNVLNKTNLDYINYDFRKLKRENAILKLNKTMNLQKENPLNKSKDSSIIEKNNLNKELLKYTTARLDIKNKGNESNSIKILSISDTYYVRYPKWFKNNEGEGVIIQSQKNKLDLKIECVNDGILTIFLRGMDIKDKNSKRFPIYIDFKTLLINGKEYLKNNLLVSHDHHYICKQKVKSGDIIKIHTEWYPFTKNSEYKN